MRIIGRVGLVVVAAVVLAGCGREASVSPSMTCEQFSTLPESSGEAYVALNAALTQAGMPNTEAVSEADTGAAFSECSAFPDQTLLQVAHRVLEARASVSEAGDVAPEPPVEGSAPEGIVMADPAAYAMTVSVVAVLPDGDGTELPVATFNGSPTAMISTGYLELGGSLPVVARAMFSPTFDRIVAGNPQALESGNLIGDIGWLTREGVYENVSFVDGDGGDFGDIMGNDTPAFAPDGTYWFARRVPSDQLLSKNDPTMYALAPGASVLTQGPALDHMNFTVVDGGPPEADNYASFHRIDAVSDQGCRFPSDFNKQGECLGMVRGSNILYVLDAYPRATFEAGETPDFDSGEALFEETNQRVFHGVFSPEGDQVAFFAESPDGQKRLFVVDRASRVVTRVGGEGDVTYPSSYLLVDWL